MQRDISSFRFVIFDADGTLLRGQSIYRKLLPLVIKLPLGWYHNSIYLPSGTLPLPPRFHWIYNFAWTKGLVITADRIISIFLALGERLIAGNPLYENAEEVLENLGRKGATLFISTGSPRSLIVSALEKCGLFSLIYEIGGVEESKPEHLRLFAQSVGLSQEEFAQDACFVSDHPIDLSVAHSKGVYGIGLSSTVSGDYLFRGGANEVISDLRELLS